MRRESGVVSGYFRHGRLVADRYGRRVIAVTDPEDGATVYVTETGRILAKDPAPRVDSRHWLLIAGERFLILSGMGFWLLLVLIAFGGRASGQDVPLSSGDVPSWVLRGIAAVETGVHWHDTGHLDGTWARSSTDDVSPWGISPAVLKDLRLSAHADRLHRDPVFAESIARRWLLHLHGVTGCWLQTCAAWRAGLRGRHRAWARDYAERARNYGTTY